MLVLLAGLWGFFAGSALLIGAIIGYFFRMPKRLVASIMAFGAGVLISAIAFELMDEAYKLGGFLHATIGFISGAVIFTGVNVYLARKGGKHRKRSGDYMLECDSLAIAVGSILDGIPESVAIGLTMIKGGVVSMATVIAIFLSNIPEGLSSSVGMKKSGWKAISIFGLWLFVAFCTAMASLAGYTLFNNLPNGLIATNMALAAGAILAMLVDTMIPEAFSETHELAGLITVLGFIVSFILSKI
ncbi:ZIP family zinc transporter [Methanothermobacter sp. DP]|uniref:ZIP family metal transporter n=1 Tax=unclassified Methanothermobacter TaxID=2631116 RepID=UPI002AA5751D|nr:ZIP family zinc transporter [Methanothermobacter sp. DP]